LSPISAQIKFLQSIVASFLLDSSTVPVTVQAAMLMSNTSSGCKDLTFFYLSSVPLTPNKLVSKWNLMPNLLITGGIFPGTPKMFPVSLSALVKLGSICRPTAIRPPGTA